MVWFCNLAAPGWGRGDSEAIAAISIVSPPPDVRLPIGQGIQVRYRASGAVILELRGRSGEIGASMDDPVGKYDPLAVDRVQRGQEVVHFWSPTAEGRYCFTVIASQGQGSRRVETLVPARCCVIALPAGSRTQLPGK
jgi:hypothetical protein